MEVVILQSAGITNMPSPITFFWQSLNISDIKNCQILVQRGREKERERERN
jgi:hypothetical protein